MAKRNIIAILRGVKPDEVEDIGAALVEAGIETIEVPLNSPDPFTSIERLVNTLGGKATVGAGTVLTVEEVRRLKDVGGQLVVSPNCDVDVIRATRENGMMSWPGVMTPSECLAALKAGADGLKLFPAELIGPAGLKAIGAILPPETETYAVGGVHAGNFGEWFAAGATGFGIGSNLYKPGRTAAEIAGKTRELVDAYDRALEEVTGQ